MRSFLRLIFLYVITQTCPVCAQVFDDFHDQNLLNGLLWQGDLSHVTTNPNRQLQLSADSSGSSSIYFHYLSPDSNLQCQFWLRQNFSPSSLNWSRFYIRADHFDLLNATNALYLEFGESGTQDAPKLFLRQNGNDSLLAQGPLGSIASAFQLFFQFKYFENNYSLNVRNNMTQESTIWFSGSLPNLPLGAFTGLVFTYTNSNKENFFFDDLYFGPILETGSPHLIMTEIMSDPEPSNGLPITEYIELYNAGNFTQQLNGWKIQDDNTTCTLPSFWLHPSCYVTVVPTGHDAGFNQSNTIVVTSFPNLNNTAETIQLFHDLEPAKDVLSYSIEWHLDSIKKLGGYSLERRSLQEPCSDFNNWGSCQAILGGTPGGANSILDTLQDTLVPNITCAEVIDSINLSIYFSEPIDTLSLLYADINFSNNLGNFSREVFDYGFNQANAQLKLNFETPIPFSQPFEIFLFDFIDCWGNSNSDTTEFVNYQRPKLGDLVINELLFDPPAGGSDFVELYNKSNKYLDLSGCHISNGINSIEIFSTKLSPHEYVAFCPDTNFLMQFYPATSFENISAQSLPYFYNDSGTCELIYKSDILDQLHYSASWHSPLIENQEGVSLERLDAFGPTQSYQNWFSASKTIGFGTPGRENSQQLSSTQKGALVLSHPELSPDQDGYHDFLEINYQLPVSFMMGQVIIYSLSGDIVKRLIINELLDKDGSIIWDGSTEYGTIADFGIYVLDFKAFSTEPGVFFSRKVSFARCIKH